MLVPMAPTWITGRRRPLIVGAFRGLAGSAAIALLVLATIPSPMWAMTYLAMFGTGTFIGVSGITACIAAPDLALGGTGSRAKALMNGCEVIGLGFGL